MKIQVSGKGIHRREVPGIESLRALPADWYCFTNLELVDSGSMPRQIDVVIVLDDRILIADLKDWNGRITSDADRWFLNGKSIDTSPVKKILENARIIKGLLQRYLKKELRNPVDSHAPHRRLRSHYRSLRYHRLGAHGEATRISNR